jgi:hypothetical protein
MTPLKALKKFGRHFRSGQLQDAERPERSRTDCRHKRTLRLLFPVTVILLDVHSRKEKRVKTQEVRQIILLVHTFCNGNRKYS